MEINYYKVKIKNHNKIKFVYSNIPFEFGIIYKDLMGDFYVKNLVKQTEISKSYLFEDLKNMYNQFHSLSEFVKEEDGTISFKYKTNPYGEDMF